MILPVTPEFPVKKLLPLIAFAVMTFAAVPARAQNTTASNEGYDQANNAASAGWDLGYGEDEELDEETAEEKAREEEAKKKAAEEKKEQQQKKNDFFSSPVEGMDESISNK